MHYNRGAMQYRQAPWAISKAIFRHGGGCPRSVASRETSRL